MVAILLLENPSFEELQAIFIPEDREHHQRIVQKAIEEAQPYEIVLRFHRPDGQLVYMQGRGGAHCEC